MILFSLRHLFQYGISGLLIYSSATWSKPDKAEKKLNTVKAAILKEVLVRDEFNLLGEVLSHQASEIKSPENLIVKKVHTKVGEEVKKGQILIELIKQDQDLSFNSRKIIAPINGTITSFGLVVGQYISAQQTLIKMANLQDLYLQTFLTWNQYTEIKDNNFQVKFLYQKEPISLLIHSIGKAMDEMGSIPLRLVCSNCKTDLIYKSQMVLSLRVKEHKYTLVPKESIFYIGDEPHINRLVKKEEGHFAKRMKVKLGKTFQDQRVLLSGLELKQIFVASNQKFIANDEEVEISNQEELFPTKPSSKEAKKE
ncbi:HlyD family efflux transporter periplasmic adaptor subunit [Bacteriovoracaceae bacterium]|nr:HlyD family efflux transporter periplasmic adaptor subunit [Bacteriovoracaceae bacterium]